MTTSALRMPISTAARKGVSAVAASAAEHRVVLTSLGRPVAVVGYDNIEEGGFLVPPLTTIDPGLATSTGLILDLLIGARKGEGGHIGTPFSLVQR